MNTKRCITFAGAVGSSKTPIANYLSTSLALPVLNNDAIRTEVTEDLLVFDRKTYDDRQESRCRAMLTTGHSFIYDASIDRKWPTLRDWLAERDYRCFIISLDLSHDLLTRLYDAKGYKNSGSLPAYIEQHAEFTGRYHDLIGLTITDADFSDRLEISRQRASAWLAAGL